MNPAPSFFFQMTGILFSLLLSCDIIEKRMFEIHATKAPCLGSSIVEVSNHTREEEHRGR